MEELLPVIMRFPDVLKTEKQEIKEKEWMQINTLIYQVINETDSF